jgi:hypothetical protein
MRFSSSAACLARPRLTSPRHDRRDGRVPQFVELCFGAELILSFGYSVKLLHELFCISCFRSFRIVGCY